MNDSTRLVEQGGVGYFVFKSFKFGALVRLVSAHDKGVDAELEISDSLSVNGKKPILGVQIKSRSDAKKLSSGCFSVTVTEKNIRYWNQYGRPVIMVLYDDSTETMRWARVDNQEARTIHIDSNSIYDESAIKSFIYFYNDYAFKLSQNISLIEFEPLLTALGATYSEISGPIKAKLQDFYNAYKEECYEKACELIRPIADIYESSKEILSNATSVNCQCSNIDALRYAECLLKCSDLGYREYEIVATCYANFGKPVESALLYERSLKIKEDATTLNNYALLSYRNKNYFKAECLFEKLVNTNKCDEKSFFNYALLATAIGRTTNAIIYYDMAIQLNPKFQEAYSNKALLNQAMGDHEEAFKTFEAGVEQCESGFSLFTNYAKLLKDYGNNDEALNYYLSALTENTEDATWKDVALIYCRKGLFGQAEEILSSHIDAIFGAAIQFHPEKFSVILDCGFEVLYSIKISVRDGRVKVVEFEDWSAHSIFNILRASATENNVSFDDLKREFLKEDAAAKLENELERQRTIVPFLS